MIRFTRVAGLTAALSLGILLSGCESFDPTDIFSADMFSTKKKLPGDRQAVFPEGTPGVDQGVPRELVKGYQPPSEPEPAQAQAEEPKAKPKPKPKPKTVAKPPASEPAEPTTGSVRPAQTQRPEQPAQPQPQQRAQPTTGGWPGSPQPKGQVAWPDPPAAGTFSR